MCEKHYFLKVSNFVLCNKIIKNSHSSSFVIFPWSLCKAKRTSPFFRTALYLAKSPIGVIRAEIKHHTYSLESAITKDSGRQQTRRKEESSETLLSIIISGWLQRRGVISYILKGYQTSHIKSAQDDRLFQ